MIIGSLLTQPIDSSHWDSNGILNMTATSKFNTILLVDDEPNVLKSLRRLIRTAKYNIILANSGKEALEVLAKENVDVVLSDQRMPEMTGTELFKKVKDKYPHTVRMILSGYTELDCIAESINDGAIFRFLTKPWSDEELLNHIKEAFDFCRMKHNDFGSAEAEKVLFDFIETIDLPIVIKDQDNKIFASNHLANQTLFENTDPTGNDFDTSQIPAFAFSEKALQLGEMNLSVCTAKPL